MPALPHFLRRYPNLQLQIHMQTQPKEMHVEGVDVLLRIGDPPPSGLIARPLARIRYAIYAAPEYLKIAGTPASPDDLLRHRCLVFKPPWMTKPLDEWEFERSGERKLIKLTPAVVTHELGGMIAAVVAGAGLARLGSFDPNLVTSGQLRAVLTDWPCSPGYPIFAMYRKTTRMPPKITAFLEFVEEAFTAFDPEEITILHRNNDSDPQRGTKVLVGVARGGLGRVASAKR